MEPVTLVLRALTAGARGTGARSEAGTEAYEQLKGLIKDRVTDKAEATLILERFEPNPEGQQDAVRELLAAAQIHGDPGALRWAHEVLEIVESDPDGGESASSADVDPQDVVDDDYE